MTLRGKLIQCLSSHLFLLDCVQVTLLTPAPSGPRLCPFTANALSKWPWPTLPVQPSFPAMFLWSCSHQVHDHSSGLILLTSSQRPHTRSFLLLNSLLPCPQDTLFSWFSSSYSGLCLESHGVFYSSSIFYMFPLLFWSTPPAPINSFLTPQPLFGQLHQFLRFQLWKISCRYPHLRL